METILIIVAYVLVTIIWGAVVSIVIEMDNMDGDWFRFLPATIAGIGWPLTLPLTILGFAMYLTSRKIKKMFS